MHLHPSRGYDFVRSSYNLGNYWNWILISSISGVEIEFVMIITSPLEDLPLKTPAMMSVCPFFLSLGSFLQVGTNNLNIVSPFFCEIECSMILFDIRPIHYLGNGGGCTLTISKALLLVEELFCALRDNWGMSSNHGQFF